MTRTTLTLAITTALCLFTAAASPSAQAAEWTFDKNHASFVFKVRHFDHSYVFGMFRQYAGTIRFDEADLENASFHFTIQADSIDTNQPQRDEHLRSADFFDVQQFPTITLQSTSVMKTDDGYKLDADVTLRGVTKPISIDLKKVGQGPDPRGTDRIGFYCEFTIKRSDFGMSNMLNLVGDDVTLYVSFEATR